MDYVTLLTRPHVLVSQPLDRSVEVLFFSLMSSASETSAPSTAAIALATGILCALGGYLVGQASSLGLFGSGTRKTGTQNSWPNSYDVTIHPDSSDEELMKSLKGKDVPESEDDESDDDDQGELKPFDDNKEECKLVLVVRTDLGMTKGRYLLP